MNTRHSSRPDAADDGDRGSVTIWTLGMVFVVFFFGWLSLSLWSGFATRRELATSADQAAQAGATALDLDAYRATGQRRLDRRLAEQRAQANLAEQHLTSLSNVTINATDTEIVVILESDVDSGLLNVLGDNGTLHVRVVAVGTPRQDTP